MANTLPFEERMDAPLMGVWFAASVTVPLTLAVCACALFMVASIIQQHDSNKQFLNFFIWLWFIGFEQ